MIWTVILVACLASAPTECRRHEMLITAGANPVSAYIEAQTQASAWLAERPELKQHTLILRPGREI